MLSPRKQGDYRVNRRDFLKFGLMLTGAALLPARVIANAQTAAAERALSLYNTHTGETLRAVYWAQGQYHPEALREIDHILRDHRSNEIRPIEPALLDLLHALHGRLEGRQPFEIISGYRSPATNARLAADSGRVARNSLHIQGQAIDIRLPGHTLGDLRQAAIDLRAGGVGYYPRSDFVHVDIGRVRYW